MRRAIIVTIFLMFTFQNINIKAQEKIQWVSIEEAYKLNKKEPKKLFIDVYTSWCGWCKRMDKTTFADEEVAAYVNRHFYAIKMNAESGNQIKLQNALTTPREIARSMRVASYPTIVFMDSDFKTIQPVPGYRTAAQFLKILKLFKEKGIKG